MFDLLPLMIPAAAAMLALPFGIRTRPGEKTVRAVYLFHRSGDPVVTVASDQVLPFEADQPEPVLGAVRDFVETSDRRGLSQSRGPTWRVVRRFLFMKAPRSGGALLNQWSDRPRSVAASAISQDSISWSHSSCWTKSGSLKSDG